MPVYMDRPLTCRLILPMGFLVLHSTLFPLSTQTTRFKSKCGSEEKPYLVDTSFLVKQLQKKRLKTFLAILTPTPIPTQKDLAKEQP